MEERVIMILWKNHHAYILRRFVMIEVIKLIEPLILLIISISVSPFLD
jgi:hypothetical protein